MSSIVLAFSGGLDTSFCVPYLQETYECDVHTVTVDTGGVAADGADAIRSRALELGAAKHHFVDRRAELYDDHLSYLIKGNVRRGGVYPLCVGPERVVQARAVVAVAKAVGARRVAHGSTGAGNDQVRFDVALRLAGRTILGEAPDVLAPVRSLGLSRQASTEFLESRGFSVPDDTTTYSINRGLWGTTIGGKETLTSDGAVPASAYPDTTAPSDAPDTPQALTLTFEKGMPTAVDGEAMDGVALVEALNGIGGRHGVGRDVHVGDTILGIKGRVAFEAPAAEILLTAHRELEKVVLSSEQQHHKAHLGNVYGRLIHEGQYFDPFARDLEAFFDSTQQVVSGTVTVQLYRGSVQVQGVASPNSMFDASTATYGEETALWDGRDAEGYTKLAGIQSLLAAKARDGAPPDAADGTPVEASSMAEPTGAP